MAEFWTPRNVEGKAKQVEADTMGREEVLVNPRIKGFPFLFPFLEKASRSGTHQGPWKKERR